VVIGIVLSESIYSAGNLRLLTAEREPFVRLLLIVIGRDRLGPMMLEEQPHGTCLAQFRHPERE